MLLKIVIAAAAETKLPVLIGASEGERELFATRQIAGPSGAATKLGNTMSDAGIEDATLGH